ncbi:hypothetical protein [Skermanella stibiiresistens]|uniref:hypothetical protein n=1 Tax=Skermanella stibiiresistens TaxID=913326 RepID=UPI0012FBC8D1|nr:hypothetical protein [Skermanella stibiiresistens]
MTPRAETRADRLDRLDQLSRLARRLEPVSLEDRARLESSAHLGNLPKADKP